MGLAKKKWDSMPFFIRPPKTTLVGPGDTVIIPKTTKQFDWECELAVFIGKTLKNASKQEAAAAVAGYAIGLDLSCRDLIQVDNDLKVDLVRGKAQDTMSTLRHCDDASEVCAGREQHPHPAFHERREDDGRQYLRDALQDR